MDAVHELNSFYLSKEEPVKSCLLALRSMILAQDSLVSETRKYGMPCFCYKKKMFCYLWTDKKTEEPYILFVEGKLLDHPMLEVGSRARMKIFRIDPNIDLPIEEIVFLLNKALDICKGAV